MNKTSPVLTQVLKGIVIAGILVLTLSYLPTTHAAQGCGGGYHRDPLHPHVCVRNVDLSPYSYHHSNHCWRNARGYLRCN